jgi:hypothetical protein
VLRAACGSVLHLVLIAVLSLGIATAVRESAVAIGLILGLLYLFPIVTDVVGTSTGRSSPAPWCSASATPEDARGVPALAKPTVAFP